MQAIQEQDEGEIDLKNMVLFDNDGNPIDLTREQFELIERLNNQQ